MVLGRRVITGLVFFVVFASLPLFAAQKRGDVGNSQDGLFSNCPPTRGYQNGVCAFLNPQGTVTLTGTDMSGNAVAVAISLYDWGYYPCTKNSCKSKPVINYALLDVVLTGTDSAGIESVVVKGVLSSPTYVACDGSGGGPGCMYSPQPDGLDVQEPTPIAGADSGIHVNTRWDFGGLPPLSPPLPAVPFDQLSCMVGDDTNPPDAICESSPLGEALLVVANSVAKNKLNTDSSNYLVTLTDGTLLGTFAVPASPTKQVVNTNNTQATAKAITKATYKDYTDASQAYPQINADGTEQYSEGFTPLPLANPPACNPTNSVTGQTDNRTFRTAWYSYTAPANGSITIHTAGSRYDTLVYVFTGSASAPTVVGCNDDPPTGGLLQAGTAFNVTQGTNYQIVVGESPTFQTNRPGSLTGYPLSVDGTLYFSFHFSTTPVIPTTTITSSLNPSTFGQSVVFSATVTSNGFGTPTGTVTFSDGSTTLGTSPLSGGTATLSAVPLTAGTNVITAAYSGDFGTSSGSMNQAVNQATTTLALTSSQNPSGLGQSVILTAAITPQYTGQATGTVTFYDGGTTLGFASVNANSASLATSALSFGAHSITATYSGDSNFTGSTAKALAQVVENPSTTTLASSPNPSIIGNPVTFTVTVTSPAGTPTGTVELLEGTAALTTLTLTSGSAQYVTPQLPLGSNVITAVYSGNSNIAGSTSAPVNQVVMLPSNFSILHTFGGGTDGANPLAGLVQDAQGNLYGTTEYGGANYGGTVFKVDTTGQETVLHGFNVINEDGNTPLAGLVQDAQGNFYGTTFAGGTCNPGGAGCGTVFKVSPSGQETLLHSFTGTGGDGENPVAGLVLDTQGNLYGTTLYGGDLACSWFGCGTVFKIDTTGHETVLYSFTGAGGDGASPEGGLVRDAQGNLYGTTMGGGLACSGYNGRDCGTVFKVDAAGHETVLYRFTGTGGDGAIPYAGLVQDAQGNLYGTTANGGDLACSHSNLPGCGTVFKVTTSGQETVLYSFTGSGGDGVFPYAGLVLDTQGNLYGTTENGGNLAFCSGYGCGTVFKVDTSGQETVLYSFSGGDDGGVPAAGLARDTQGNLFGTTVSGGANYVGTVFKLTPQ